jgi:hypothetical protein
LNNLLILWYFLNILLKLNNFTKDIKWENLEIKSSQKFKFKALSIVISIIITTAGFLILKLISNFKTQFIK